MDWVLWFLGSGAEGNSPRRREYSWEMVSARGCGWSRDREVPVRTGPGPRAFPQRPGPYLSILFLQWSGVPWVPTRVSALSLGWASQHSVSSRALHPPGPEPSPWPGRGPREDRTAIGVGSQGFLEWGAARLGKPPWT